MKKKVLGVFVVLLVVAVSFAYAAANTVPVTGAGDGQEEISGYNVTGVHYVLDATDPGKIASVTFTLSPKNQLVENVPATANVKVKLGDPVDTWHDCNSSDGTTWSCTIGGVAVVDAVQLRVVAAQ